MLNAHYAGHVATVFASILQEQPGAAVDLAKRLTLGTLHINVQSGFYPLFAERIWRSHMVTVRPIEANKKIDRLLCVRVEMEQQVNFARCLLESSDLVLSDLISTSVNYYGVGAPIIYMNAAGIEAAAPIIVRLVIMRATGTHANRLTVEPNVGKQLADALMQPAPVRVLEPA